MIKRQLSLARTPALEDPDLTRRAGLVRNTALILLVINLAAIPLIWFSGSNLVIVAMLLVSAAILAISLGLLRWGTVSASSLFLCLGGWTIFMVATVLQGGLGSVLVVTPLIFIFLAGLLVSERAILAMSGLTLLAYSLILAADQMGVMPTPVSPISSFSRWGGLTVILAAFTALYVLTLRSLRQALKEARDNQAQLRQTVTDLETTRQGLELRVSQRTRDLQARAHQLETWTQISHNIASIRPADAALDPTLQEITTLIGQRFDIYHVGIYLLATGAEPVDMSAAEKQPGEADVVPAASSRPGAAVLTLRTSSSTAGLRLVESGYQIKPNQGGIINAAANSLNPYLALDVQRDPLYSPLPGLEQTAAQLALPLVAGGKLYGVLDLHFAAQASKESETAPDLATAYEALMANPNEVAATYRTLADQVAIAIENAQLFRENQRSLETIQRAYSAISQEAWQKLLRSQPDLGYLSNPATGAEPVPVQGAWKAEMLRAAQEQRQVQTPDGNLVIPIKIRDQVTGVVRLRKATPAAATGLAGQSESRPAWTQDEIDLMQILSERLSTALESARLYDETRRRAERERLTGEITARVRASNDPQVILQTAVQELRRALQADRAQLLVHRSPSQAPPSQPGQARPVPGSSQERLKPSGQASENEQDGDS